MLCCSSSSSSSIVVEVVVAEHGPFILPVTTHGVYTPSSSFTHP